MMSDDSYRVALQKEYDFPMKATCGKSATRALLWGAVVALLVASPFTAANAGWIEKKAPILPYGVYIEGQQGSVVVSIMLDQSGRVTGTHVVRSSGFPSLDGLATDAAKRWRLSSDSVVPTDLTQGRIEMIKFVNPPPAPGKLPPNTVPYWASR